MKNIKVSLTFLTIFFLGFTISSLFADYQIKGSFSAISSTINRDFKLMSRVGEPIMGSTGHSSLIVRSGFSDFELTAIANENSETLLSVETAAFGNETVQNTPTEFKLFENYPNPFNPTTTIRFDIPSEATVTIKIYDVRGREVNTLLRGKFYEAGRYEMIFDASHLSSGIYLYRITTGSYSDIKKMMLLK